MRIRTQDCRTSTGTGSPKLRPQGKLREPPSRLTTILGSSTVHLGRFFPVFVQRGQGGVLFLQIGFDLPDLPPVAEHLRID